MSEIPGQSGHALPGPRRPLCAKPKSHVFYSITSSVRSARRKPRVAKRCLIGFNLRCITAELGLEPFGNREIRPGHQQLLCGSSGFLRLACLLIDDHEIGKAKSGISGMIRLKGCNRLIGAPRQAVSVSESAQIHCRIVRSESNRLFAQHPRVFGIPRSCMDVAGEFGCISRPRSQFDCLSSSGDGFIVVPLKQQSPEYVRVARSSDQSRRLSAVQC